MSNIENKKSPMGHVGTVDNLGRIIIPAPIRRACGMERGESIEMVVIDEGLLLRKYQPGCIFCGNILDLTMFGGKMICRECIKKMSENI